MHTCNWEGNTILNVANQSKLLVHWEFIKNLTSLGPNFSLTDSGESDISTCSIAPLSCTTISENSLALFSTYIMPKVQCTHEWKTYVQVWLTP